MTAATHLHAPDLDALLKLAGTRRVRCLLITDAPPLPPGLVPDPVEAPAASSKRKARK